MLFKEIDDCENCPIKEEGICTGETRSDGRGNAIEPPCAILDEDDNVEDFIDACNKEYEF